ncbi:MAG: DUF3536 domain-containing protein [Chitinophagales bacterium]
MKKFICIHGHFYQPPRENAWTDEIDLQHSAFPFRDWNERINTECYEANAKAKIHIFHANEPEFTTDVNNYEKISFNFGPTLLHWMKKHAKATYKKIIDADKISCKEKNGHGNAIAQVYNHIIMPLANDRDKQTQVIWGIQDFVSHFGRYPEGMWLAETAVDTATLEILAGHNIAFTILSPRQAKAYRESRDKNWVNISAQQDFNTNVPYLCKLPSGKSISLFFYNGELAQDVAFNRLLSDGHNFYKRIITSHVFDDSIELTHIATDGETYGHHHRYGEMGLAACIYFAEYYKNVSITNYAEFLAGNPPQQEVLIHENSSWSCVHGVERWRNDCGCSDGEGGKFKQQWRAPLRKALDWLRDELGALYEKEISKYHGNAWELRDKYIEVILKKTSQNEFISKYIGKIKNEEGEKISTLLEMQKYAQLMYTSCAWFFDEVSRIETKQVLQYAKRAIEIAEIISLKKFEGKFLELLELAPSNVEKYKTAAEVYKSTFNKNAN